MNEDDAQLFGALRMRRIAWCSPVNPAPTGISDYSEELLPYLGQYAEVTLYVDDHLRPTNPNLAKHLQVVPLRRLEHMHRRTPYDAIVYHMGNSPAHAGIWRMAQRIPGVVVLHDFVLHHFMLWYAANVQHDIQHYVRAMREQYGDVGNHVAQLMIRGRFTEEAFAFPCCEPVLAVAHGLIVHSQYVRQGVARLRPDLPVGIVPMGIPLPLPIARAAARRRLNIPEEALILASFGHINAYKRIEVVLQALATLRISLQATHPHIRYVLVGSVSPNYDAIGVIRRMGMDEVVQMTGYVTPQEFADYVAATDICLNLRHPTAGETSASLLRLLGAGRPVLVTATGSFTEVPQDVVVHIEVGPYERDDIIAYCQLLALRPDIAATLGTYARHYVAQHHTLERAAVGYMQFLSQLYGWNDTITAIHPIPLWDVHQNGVSAISMLIPHVAQHLVDIGVTEHDPVVSTVAQCLDDLMGVP